MHLCEVIFHIISRDVIKCIKDLMETDRWKWVVGLTYIFAVATIWIAASFAVQSVVGEGVAPFLVTYICNSLFIVYIPLVELGRYLEDKYGSLLFWRNKKDKRVSLQETKASELTGLVDKEDGDRINESSLYAVPLKDNVEHLEQVVVTNTGLDAKGRWTRRRVAKVSLIICPLWFMAQFACDSSLKYTTVTSNTILSSTSSLFTFLVALVFLDEKFTWLKLCSVLLCTGGSIIVSWGDKAESSKVAPSPVLGDSLAILSSALYAAYITLIRQKLPDEDDESKGHASMAQFLGFLGLFNFLIFLPVALLMSFAKLESVSTLTWKQVGLIIGKGLLDNVLSDYLWAKAVLLTTTTVASAGLTIQVPMAAVVDLVIGNRPPVTNYVGAAAVMVGFAGINIPSDALSRSNKTEFDLELASKNLNSGDPEGL